MNIDTYDSSYYHSDCKPRFPPFLLYVRCKFEVTFVRGCFSDGKRFPLQITFGDALLVKMLITLEPQYAFGSSFEYFFFLKTPDGKACFGHANRRD